MKTLQRTPPEDYLDNKFWFNGAEKPPTSLLVGPETLSKKLYHLCKPEDLELAKMLVRRTRIFHDDLAKESLLTEEKFDSVDRAFVMCEEDQQVHFVLVHGLCHGAWCWYKLATLLKSSGHQVTALDLGGCGADSRGLKDVNTLDKYLQPLMDFLSSLPNGEKVVLVGHSFGGFGVTKKVLVAVFLSAYMPNFTSPFSTLVEETFKRTSTDQFLDTSFGFDKGPKNPATSIKFGQEILSAKLYQNCLPEDLELARILVRESNIFCEELVMEGQITKEKFGSVDRVFVICKEDKLMKEDFQKWIIEKSPPKEVKFIQGADHMGMLSRPKEICLCLMEIAYRYSSK
ncbi:hypothetical protein V2J09_021817 [Rumex salicifolius]